MKPKITLLTWMAVNNDPDALKSLIKHLEKKYEIDQILYLYQKELAKKLNEVRPLSSVLTPIEVAVKNPTVHKDIYSTIKGLIIPKLANIKNLVINVSSGTPAMHAVWLILYAAGEFPVGTRLISSQKNRTAGTTSCDNVDFPISTYLSELRKYEKENPDEGSYNPEAKSEARRQALERIRVYSRVQGVPLLLLGEKGIGKSHLVESIIAPIK
ncbi:MAG: RNA polymerase subunit sigma-54, partial [Fibrobacteraceae bacterium]|nr:RNA polymerase subunit sigma-54 [Fibrobacteraceae bacterium]